MLIHLFCGAFGVIRKHKLFWIGRELGKAEEKTRIIIRHSFGTDTWALLSAW